MSAFQIGQRVRVVGNEHAYSKNLNRTGSITEQHGHIFRVQFDDNDPEGKGQSDTAYAHDLELVVEATPFQSVKEQIAAIEAALAALKTTIGL